jgi:ribosomal protein L37E
VPRCRRCGARLPRRREPRCKRCGLPGRGDS